MKKYPISNIHYLLILFIIFSILGCDAFVRKFTRKPKKEESAQQELVLAPEEYQGKQIPKQDLYRQYFLYWKSWQDELIDSLLDKKSNKKQVDCAKEAIKNLESLKPLLNEAQQKKFDVYLSQMKELKDSIADDLYGISASSSRQEAERLRRDILRDFSYSKISKGMTLTPRNLNEN